MWITASGKASKSPAFVCSTQLPCCQALGRTARRIFLDTLNLFFCYFPVSWCLLSLFLMPSGWTLFDQTPPKCWIPAFLEILCASRNVGWKWAPRWSSKDKQGLPLSTSLQEGAVSHSQSIAPSAVVAALSLTNQIHFIPQHQFPKQLT